MADELIEKGWFKQTLESFVKYVALNPKEFIFYVFIILTPLMAVSGILSLKLAKHIERNEKEKKKATRQTNLAKSRRRAKAD
ncbi:Small integral membrane protein 15 [Desmophyllum pertusum]|uniref:Small integral membrane protein 15 n=1 Tax=Desmophyllum pertusum TaxID=174260 RepID=A0A9W9YEG9_9CNID|nr:Small integral membrane protein 15 [Desmophyllum pertusum]